MSCLNMLSNEQQQVLYAGSTMGPRISFSSDFSAHDSKHENSYREPPVSSDFEFSISGNSMISADEVFFKGKLLPLKESPNKTTTLKDELLLDDDEEEEEEEDVLPRIPKSCGRWKERLGFRRGQINSGSNKVGEEVVVNLSPFSLHDKKGFGL